jgi:hypothetical protein
MPSAPQKIKNPKKGGWFQKIPSDVLFSPGGIILIFFAIATEAIDAIIPIPIVSQLWNLPLEIIFIVLLVLIAKVSIKSLIIPFLVERIPVISNILPTWVIRMFM